MRIEIETKEDFNGEYFSVLTCKAENSQENSFVFEGDLGEEPSNTFSTSTRRFRNAAERDALKILEIVRNKIRASRSTILNKKTYTI